MFKWQIQTTMIVTIMEKKEILIITIVEMKEMVLTMIVLDHFLIMLIKTGIIRRGMYWNGHTANGQIVPPRGWPVYRPLSSLSEVERADIRVGESKMVSYKDQQRYESTGITLKWGEYYVADDEMSSGDEQSTISEAEEVTNEEVNEEDKLAASLAINNTSHEPSAMNYDQLERDIEAPTPTLMGVPDIVLEKILHYSTDEPSEVCEVELVCKRFRRLTTGEEFWARHPASEGWSEVRYHNIKANLPLTRDETFQIDAIRKVTKYQNLVGNLKHFQSDDNVILDVLGDGEECVADTFRTLSADILSRMNYLGPEAHFRLRGDTIGYICELLQAHMIERLEVAVVLAIHKLGYSPYQLKLGFTPPSDRVEALRHLKLMRGCCTRCSIDGDDIVLAFQKDMSRPFFCGVSSQRPTRCSVATGVHGKVSVFDCSCSLPSSSGIVWRWPGDNCHDTLPLEAGRRIIRRLAYLAGLPRMSNEAFVLVEAELLHTLGMLLATAYESSVAMARSKAHILDEEDELAYNEPTVSIDMFNTPPPPFQNEQLLYTVVPGQIRSAAKERGITPSHVYGDVWVASSGFTKEEEEEIERSYYYQSVSSGDDEESEEVCSGETKSKAAKQKDSDDDGSDTSIWSVCNSVEDSELDIDDYDEDSYLAEYRLGGDEIVAHYNHFPITHIDDSDSDEDDSDNDDEEDIADDNDA